MDLQRIAITGSSGFYGRAIIRTLRDRHPDVTILGLDVSEPPDSGPDQFEQCDVLSEELPARLKAFEPDTVVHLAFIVNPIRDDDLMHRVNVEGTRNVLQAAINVSVKRILTASSATAMGGWPDNPVPMDDDWEPRAVTQYRYAHDKFTIEEMLGDFRRQHPDVRISWTRPCIIYGPEIRNYLTQFILNGPIIVLPAGNNTELQFVHLDDVAMASVRMLEAGVSGGFNLAPPDWVTLRDLGKLSGRRCVPMPFAACKAFTTVWWSLRLPFFCFPSGLWYFIRYPWVVAPTRLKRELNFEFRHSSEDTVKLLLSDADKLAVR